MKVLCHVMQVSRSGFYDGVRRDDTDSEREQLVGRVREIHKRKAAASGVGAWRLPCNERGLRWGAIRPGT